MYRAALTFHPEIAVFACRRDGPRQGVWRVARCWPSLEAGGARPCLGQLWTGAPLAKRALFIDSARRLQVGSYVNPARIALEALLVRTQVSQQRRYA